MMRIKNAILMVPFIVAAALPMATAARVTRPAIRGEEVGYYGGAIVTHEMSVFVYSNLGPRSGNRVTVCVRRTCERARGHNARLAWYSVSFSTRGLHMGDPVRFTVIASDAAGSSRVTVTRPLLCMHNNGSTPQT